MSNYFATTQVLNVGDYQIYLPRVLYRNPVKDWVDISFAKKEDTQYGVDITILNFQVVNVKLMLLVNMLALDPADYDTTVDETIDAFKRLAEKTALYQYSLSPFDKKADWVKVRGSSSKEIAGICDNIFLLCEESEV